LPGNVGRLLLVVAVVTCSLVAPHRAQERPFLASGEKDAFALHEEKVADVTRVFQRRPRLVVRSTANVGTRSHKSLGDLARAVDNGSSGQSAFFRPVLEITPIASVHRATSTSAARP
jgi:hypothetical protein